MLHNFAKRSATFQYPDHNQNLMDCFFVAHPKHLEIFFPHFTQILPVICPDKTHTNLLGGGKLHISLNLT